jgi:hypothetical protein
MPPMPAFPADQAHTEEALLRYEDVAQDGRVIPVALLNSTRGLWQHVLPKSPGQRAAAQGIVPILTRLTLVSLDAPIHVDQPVETRAGFQLAHDREPDGEARIFMNVWAELYGSAGRTRVDPPGPWVRAGHLFAEHTLTRLFAAPGQRRVSRLEVPGLPELPEARHDAQPPTTAGDAPPGARWLDELGPDAAEVAFTLDQTDANQHVNSLVYVRVFLDAAARRVAAIGRALTVLSRAVDIAYRKPCFAGDRVRAYVRLFGPAGEGGERGAAVAAGGLVGAAGFIAAPGEETRPRCYVRALLGTWPS